MKKKIFNKENIIIFLIPFCLFLFLLLVLSPGIITSDGTTQWIWATKGAIGGGHPFFSTYFMRLLSKIWNFPSVVLIFQVFIFSFFWTCICNTIRKQNPNSFKKQLIYTIIISFIPIISLYSITLWKDILYSYYLMFVIFYIYIGINSNFNYKSQDIFIIGILITLVFNYRQNGLLVALLLLIIFIIILIKRKIGIKKISILILSFLSLNIIISVPKKIYSEKYTQNSSDKAHTTIIDYYMIWMYGAHIRDNNIEKEDLDELNKIIPIEKWKELYDPFLVNPVMIYNRNQTYYNKNKEYFRKTFLKYSIKNPITILVHYLKADVMLWCPLPRGYVYVFDFTDWESPHYQFNNGKMFGFETKGLKFPKVKKAIEKTVTFTLNSPLKIFYQPANSLYISIILIYLLIKQNKKKNYWLLAIPMLFNTLSLLPVNLAQDLRYVYINYLSLLVIALIFICEFKFKKIVIGGQK